MSAFVLAQVPDSDIPATITGDQLTLIWMDDDVVDGMIVIVIALNARGPCIPDLDRAVLGAGHHPFALTVESEAGDVPSVAFEGQDGRRVGRTNIVELDGRMAGCSEPAFVWGDAQSINLRVWMLYGARTDAGESLPESNGMVVTRCTKDDGHGRNQLE